MNKVFTKNDWDDYIYWQTQDKKTLKRINTLIEDISRSGNEGIGNPKSLKGTPSWYWNRRIYDKNRFVYRIDVKTIYILTCRYLYSDK